MGYFGKYLMAFGTIFFGAEAYQALRNPRLGRREFLMMSGFTTASLGLSVHSHSAEQVFEAISRKNNGKVLSQEDIKSAEKYGKTGEYAHHAAAAGIAISYGTSITASRRKFLKALPATAFIGSWLYFWLYRNYDAVTNLL